MGPAGLACRAASAAKPMQSDRVISSFPSNPPDGAPFAVRIVLESLEFPTHHESPSIQELPDVAMVCAVAVVDIELLRVDTRIHDIKRVVPMLEKSQLPLPCISGDVVSARWS